MANALDTEIQSLQAQVTQENTVIDSAVTLINGISAQIKAAVDAALAAGATQAELQSLTDLQTAIKSKSDALAAAVTANTPATTGTTGS